MKRTVRVQFDRCQETTTERVGHIDMNVAIARKRGAEVYKTDKYKEVVECLGTSEARVLLEDTQGQFDKDCPTEPLKPVIEMLVDFALSTDDEEFFMGRTVQDDEDTGRVIVQLGLVWEGRAQERKKDRTAPSSVERDAEDSGDEDNGGGSKQTEWWHGMAQDTMYEYGMFYPALPDEEGNTEPEAGLTPSRWNMSDPITEKSVNSMIGRVMLMLWGLHKSGNTSCGPLPTRQQVMQYLKR
jgi:hypothetical protein